MFFVSTEYHISIWVDYNNIRILVIFKTSFKIIRINLFNSKNYSTKMKSWIIIITYRFHIVNLIGIAMFIIQKKSIKTTILNKDKNMN